MRKSNCNGGLDSDRRHPASRLSTQLHKKREGWHAQWQEVIAYYCFLQSVVSGLTRKLLHDCTLNSAKESWQEKKFASRKSQIRRMLLNSPSPSSYSHIDRYMYKAEQSLVHLGVGSLA